MRALSARAIDQRKRALAEWLDAQAARDSNGDETAWRLKPCPAPMFVNGAGELDQKHDQDLRDTCVMLLDRPGCDLLTICDITGHSYRSAQTIVKHYRARNVDRADSGISRAGALGDAAYRIPLRTLPELHISSHHVRRTTTKSVARDRACSGGQIRKALSGQSLKSGGAPGLEPGTR